MKKIMLLLFLASACAHAPKQSHLELATLWMQHSGEYRALCLQAFAAAKTELDKALKKKGKKPLAIILDVDETVLDNSPYQARAIINNQGFDTKSWDAWVDERNADAIPGAVDFLTEASRRGVEIFYVTNRPDQNKQPTYDNLRWRGFPVKLENVQTKGDDKSKQKRRDAILKKYDVIMLVGDNLGDFGLAFHEQDNEKRRALVDERHNLWGAQFIVLPNPMYGDWENVLYNGYKREERAQARMDAMRTGPFKPHYYKENK